MSGTFPTSPAPRNAVIRSQQTTIVSVTTSGRKQARQIDGQRFAITLQFPTMTRAEFAPIQAFVMKQRSQKETFQISVPDLKDAKGSISGTVLVNGAHSAGDTTIDVDGMTGEIKAGDFVNFAGDTKVYMVVSDATAVAGAATLTIEPPLRSAIADDAAVTYDGVEFTVRLTNDVQQFNTGDLDLYRFEVDFIEAL